MRCTAVILSLVVASTAGAQGTFEGVVTYQMNNNETWQYSAKGNKVRMESLTGQMPGAAMVWDMDARTTLMIMPPQKMYMSVPMGNSSGEHVADTLRGKVVKVGSEVVAGIPCDDYQGVSNSGEKQGTMCLAHGMGNFLWYRSNSPLMKRMADRVSGLSAAVANGGFPLKITKEDGTTQMIATKVEKRSVDPSVFAPPAGYTQMQMPAGMQPH